MRARVKKKNQQRRREAPKIPRFIQNAPWYQTHDTTDNLKHQRKKSYEKKPPPNLNKWYKKGTETIIGKATKYRKGACKNCGSMTHKTKQCLERKRRKGAHITGKDIQPDRVNEDIDLDYSGMHDQWATYNTKEYRKVFEKFEMLNSARKEVLREELDKQSFENMKDEDITNVEEEHGDLGKFTTGGHDSKTRTASRNLRIREDTAKYLMNLEEDAPFYDPKTRSMRENPYPNNKDAFYRGDNASRFTGEYYDFKRINKFADLAQRRGKMIDPAADPTMTEMARREFMEKKKGIMVQQQTRVVEAYGGTDLTTSANLPLKNKNVSDDTVEPPPHRYDSTMEGEEEVDLPAQKRRRRRNMGKSRNISVISRYEEDMLENGHSEVFGSYFKNGRWGYACCRQFEKNSMCNIMNKRKRVEDMGEIEEEDEGVSHDITKKRKLD